MVKCETCEHDFEKGNKFKYHKENLCAKFLACFISIEDLQKLGQIYTRWQFGAINARKSGIVNSTMSGLGVLNVIKDWAVRQSITDIGTGSIN